MTRRLLLHVGTPKTGTSYLQDVLFRNQALLREHGILYPADRFDAHFLAALDLMELPWGGLEREARGSWERLVEEVRGFDGTAIVSHEIFARASYAQVDRALQELGEGAEIHLMLSVRDLARQIPAEWQENVKHRSTLTYARFLEVLQDPSRSHRVGAWFWGVQDLPDILGRWAETLPPEQVHLITVPPRGAPRDLLWQRFVEAFDLGAVPLDLGTDRSNVSLGVPETALMRRINQQVNPVLEPVDYRPLVRELLAHRTLSQRTGSARLAMPPEVADRVEERSRAWVEQLSGRGYDVVGSLEELIGEPAGAYVDPDHADEHEMNAAAVDAIEALLLEAARLQHEVDRLALERDQARGEVDRAYGTFGHRLKRKVYLTLEESWLGRRLLFVYRRARGR